ncbi:MAG TPA: condensation domain-containing protein, partial [Pseudonocardiaceae bacterium]
MTNVHSGLSPLSETQQQVWLTEQLAPERSVFTEAMAVRIDGPLDPVILEKALGQVARRHDVLHTVFPILDGIPMQQVLPERTATVVRHDLSAVPEPHRAQALNQLARNFVDGRRDLAVDLPLRGLLVALGPSDHALVLAIHHLVADGWSARIVMTELVDRYEALRAGRSLDESPPALRYADFVAWEQALLESSLVEADTDYWRATLAGAPPLELLPGRVRPAEKGMTGRIAEFELG